MNITEDFVTTSLFTLVNFIGEDDEVTVLDEFSSIAIDTKPLDWCVAAFIKPDQESIGNLRGEPRTNLLSRLLHSNEWVDVNLTSQGIPIRNWQEGWSGAYLPTLGTNTYYSQRAVDSSRLTLDSLPKVTKDSQTLYYTSRDVNCRMGYGYSKPFMYYGVSPFLGVGTQIPQTVSTEIFDKLCILLDNPTGVHLIILGDHSKAQGIFGSGFWGIRQFLVDYYGLIPSATSTSIGVPLPFKYSVHTSIPDLEILISRYDSMSLPHAEEEFYTFVNDSLEKMLDLMWSMLYFDYTYIDADPVEQDCQVASSWLVTGKKYSEKIPFNSPALVLLISNYNKELLDASSGSSTYVPGEDVTNSIIGDNFIDKYRRVLQIIEYKSPYNQCLVNMSSYAQSFAIAMYKKTCSKKYIVMPPASSYPKKTEVRRDIAECYRKFAKDKSLVTYINTFKHLWEKTLWYRLYQEFSSMPVILSFLSRNYNLPLSSILAQSHIEGSFNVSVIDSTLENIIKKDLRSLIIQHSSAILGDTDGLPEVKFLGKDSLPTLTATVDRVLNIYADQVVYAFKEDRYSIVDKRRFDNWDFAQNVLKGKPFKEFLARIIIKRSWVPQYEDIPDDSAYMNLGSLIKLWRLTGREDLYKVLEVLVSMLTSLEIDMPTSNTSDVNYRTYIITRVGVASIKRKLLDAISHTEEGSKLGQ